MLSSKKSKEVWRTIHRILNPNEKRIKADPNTLNLHYITIAEQTTGSQKSNCEFDEITIESRNNEHNLLPRKTNYNEVLKQIKLLRNDCSTGPDEIPSKFIKASGDNIASPLTHIINSCIEKRVFPDAWKTARVHPIPKVDTPLSPSDYRPISILPTLSKIYKRIILTQLSEFIESKSIYAQTQSGFRKGHSCSSLLVKLKNDITKAMNRGEITIAIAADYSKAFDTVHYTKLLQLLKSLGLSNDFLKIIHSYLTNRNQYVQVDDTKSSTKSIYFGVPQGSILGPVLFNLYVSDLSSILENHSLQYADDTTFYAHGKVKDINLITESLDADIERMQQWSSDKNLALNSKKTYSILFGTPQMIAKHKLQEPNTFEIKCNGKTLLRKETIKLLGIHFNESLTWSIHVGELVTSGFSTLAILRKLKRFAPFHVRKSLAECMILSKIDYGSVVFCNLPQYLFIRLQKLQNAAASFVTGRYCRTQDVVKLNWLPVHERIEFAVVKLVHRVLNDENSPNYLHLTKFKPVRTTRASLRSNYDLVIPIDKNIFENIAAKSFNSLTIELKRTEDYTKFCKLAKQHYLNKAKCRVLNE